MSKQHHQSHKTGPMFGEECAQMPRQRFDLLRNKNPTKKKQNFDTKTKQKKVQFSPFLERTNHSKDMERDFFFKYLLYRNRGNRVSELSVGVCTLQPSKDSVEARVSAVMVIGQACCTSLACMGTICGCAIIPISTHIFSAGQQNQRSLPSGQAVLPFDGRFERFWQI